MLTSEKGKINNLRSYLKNPEKEQNKTKSGRWKKIIVLRIEDIKIELNFQKIDQIHKPLSCKTDEDKKREDTTHQYQELSGILLQILQPLKRKIKEYLE